MDRIQKELLFKEIKNFDKISEKYNYRNIDELIGHYIEENIINSKEELIRIVSLINNKLGININIKDFKDCWANQTN